MIKSFVAVAIVAILTIVCLFVVTEINEGRAVPVLMYHSVDWGCDGDVWTVSADEFEMQMRDMKLDGRVPILPYQLWLAEKGLYLLPRKPVLITFDDGYMDNIQVAEPIMASYGMRGICYLVMAHIADSEETRIQDRGKNKLVWPEVRSALGRGVVSFGIHSITHTPNLSRQAGEVAPARHDFKAKTGRNVDAYCFPFGNVNEKLLDTVKYKNRYKTAMVCKDKVFIFSRKADLYQIPRVSIYGGRHEFVIENATAENGFISVTVSNLGIELPFKVALRDNATGRVYDAEKPCVRLGNRQIEVVKWADIPRDVDLQRLEVSIQEQNSLFTYTNLPFASGLSMEKCR